MTEKPQTQTYIVDTAGPVAGRKRKAGDELQLTAAQAKYERVTLKPEPKGKTVKPVKETAQDK